MTVGPNKLEMDIRNVVVFPQGPGLNMDLGTAEF